MPRSPRDHSGHHHAAASTSQKLMQVNANGLQQKPAFHKILPGAMQKLVDEGLFVADANADGGYRITPSGLAKLKEING